MPQINADNTTYPLQDETYKVIGCCMKVHTALGHGFLEVVYKDALEIELRKNKIPFTREAVFDIYYDGVLLPHKFYADFMVYDSIILEAKCCTGLADEHIAQTINYLRISECQIGLLINFGRTKLEYKRLVY